jgi:hypothetical protein
LHAQLLILFSFCYDPESDHEIIAEFKPDGNSVTPRPSRENLTSLDVHHTWRI